jgi:hypothetical protein
MAFYHLCACRGARHSRAEHLLIATVMPLDHEGCSMGHEPQVAPNPGDTIAPSAHGPRMITHSPLVDSQIFTSQKATLTEDRTTRRKGQMRGAEE